MNVLAHLLLGEIPQVSCGQLFEPTFFICVGNISETTPTRHGVVLIEVPKGVDLRTKTTSPSIERSYAAIIII